MYRRLLVMLSIMFLAIKSADSQPAVPDTAQPGVDTVLKDLYLKGEMDTVRGIVIGSDVSSSGTIPLETISIRTTADTVTAYLAPSWYLEQQDISVTRFDRVMVYGSRLWYGDRWIVIARTLQKNGEEVVLRDRRGRPLWKRGADW
ncbi:MAG: hypothetical protein ACLFSB_11905 [Chitinispirillaceae bacterium]